MKRAYSLLEIKSVDDDAGVIEGIASTPSTDRGGDVVEPDGAQFKLPIPLLYQHNSRQPIGHVIAAKVSNGGIAIKAKIARGVAPFIDEAWALIKAGLIRGLSIGFKEIESADIKGSFGVRYTKWEWLELSAVTIPANAEASIISIKQYDETMRAASGREHGAADRLDKSPGVSGKPARKGFSLIPKETEMKTIAEQLAALEAARAAKAARMGELMQKSIDEGRSTDEAEATEFDDLESQVKQADADLVRLRQLEKLNIEKAKPVDDVTKPLGAPMVLRSGRDADEKFKGQNYTRKVIAKALARLDDVSPVGIAMQRWGKTNPALVEIIKAGVAGGGSGSGEWGAELVALDGRYTGDFIEFLHGATVFDKLGLREVPANVTIKGQDGAATGYWVGESKAIPVSKPDFSTVNLSPLKVAALAVVSNELLRDSSPAAEMLVRDALVNASAQRIDQTFLSATAASSGVSPAGILNGVTAIVPSGTDADAIRADILALYLGFLTAKNATGLTLVAQPSLAKVLQLMVNTLGQREFPDINTGGGGLLGDRVVVGDNVPNGALILLKPSDIYRIGDTGVEVSISREAMIEQDSAPQGASDTPTAASATLMSMFQTESTAIKVVRSINFAKRRTSAVAWIDNAEYGGVVS